MSDRPEPRHPDLWDLVRAIPRGRVVCYGDLGSALVPRLSGLLVGRRLRAVPEGIPWWRVVAVDGTLPTAKRDPRIAAEQREKLEAEGVVFADDRVVMARYRADPESP